MKVNPVALLLTGTRLLRAAVQTKWPETVFYCQILASVAAQRMESTLPLNPATSIPLAPRACKKLRMVLHITFSVATTTTVAVVLTTFLRTRLE